MNQPALASIIINNHNYGRFLGQAIDSALQQCYQPVEVIVVDDGSTDHSRSVIAGYGDRITAVLKENGGQASGFNSGFARSQGQAVIFLDADDVLKPWAVEMVMTALQANPGAAKVQYRLEVIDAGGAPTGVVRPPWQQPMLRGDLRAQVLAFPDDLAWQPTSGNAFAADVLRQVFPMPEEIYRVCADYYLSNLPPLFGPVVSLEEVGACYRVHGANNHFNTRLDLEQTRQIITRTCHTHRYIGRCAQSLGLAGFAADPGDVAAVTFMAHRLISLRLEPEKHPLPGDMPWKVFLGGLRAALGRFDRSWAARSLYALWFAAALAAPRPAVRWLAQKFFYPRPASGAVSVPAGLAMGAQER